MAFRRVTVELPSKPLVGAGFLPAAFFRHNESIEVLHVYGFEPRERLLLVRVVRSAGPLTERDIQRQRESLRRRYNLQDFEILQVEEQGRTYVALVRQENPGVLEDLLEEVGAGITPTTPTIIGKVTATLSFIADPAAERRVFALLRELDIPVRLKGRRAVRRDPALEVGPLTARQRELLSLAWNLGYFDVPARVGLGKIAELSGLSRNTVSQHLRRGLRRILRDWIG